MTVQVRRILTGDEHTDQKFLVLEGYVEGVPQVTKRRSIDTAALADGTRTFAAERAALVADVEEYLARWQAVQDALADL